jgi:dTDP-4-dehydrorhamnose 3,5-epimerase
MVEPKVIKGGVAVDDRGWLSFVNDFDFSKVKRFYQVENHSKDIIRAFHGHLKEEKYVYVASGDVMVLLVPLDNVENPNKKAKIEKYVLSSKSPSILHIPARYANGFKALCDNTKIIFFSTKSLKDSEQNDDYRYSYDYWGKDIWEIVNR